MSVAELLEKLEPIALGELNLSVDEFGEYTVKELNALTDGYIRRTERLEDLFIIYSALPVYQSFAGNKAPTYKKLTAHRKRNHDNATLSEEDLKKWREILEKGE